MYTSYYQTTPGTYLERPGVPASQLVAGMRFAHRPGVTMTQQENANDAMDSHNGAMLHFDEQYAGRTAWKRPLMVSTLTVQRLIGMASKTFARQIRIVRMGSIAMTAPVFGGDTLYAETEVLQVGGDNTAGAHGDGVVPVRLRTLGINQHGERVAGIDYEVALWGATAPLDRGGGTPAAEPRFASHLQRADGAWVEQLGLFFEDLRAGETFVHAPRRTFLQEEAVLHAARALDVGAQFYDRTLAAQMGQSHTTIPQTWVLTVVAALSTRMLGRVTTNLGWVDVEFGADVRPGDTLEVRSTVLALRDSGSRPGEGIATVRTVAVNQDAQECVSYQRTLFVYRRGEHNPYAAAGY